MIGPYLVDDITLEKHNGTDTWNEPSATTDEAIKGFIEYGEHWIQSNSGQMTVSMAKIRMRPRTIIVSGFSTRAAKTISYKDKLTFDGKDHAIMRIGFDRDFRKRVMVVYVT